MWFVKHEVGPFWQCPSRGCRLATAALATCIGFLVLAAAVFVVNGIAYLMGGSNG